MKYQLASSVAACLLTVSAVHAQNVLVNGGFEDEPLASDASVQGPGYLLLTGTDIPGWTIAPDHYATMHESPGPWLTISGSYSLNTDGEGTHGNNVDIFQDFNTTAGESYTFGFDWINWQSYLGPAQLQVSVVDPTTSQMVFDGFYGQTTLGVTNHEGTTFTGSGDTLILEIQETPQSGINDNAWVVDNFDVEGSGTGIPTVPDYSKWSAELLALAGIVGASWSFRKTTA